VKDPSWLEIPALVLRFDFEHEMGFETEEALAKAFTETGRGGGIVEIMKGEDGSKSAVMIFGKSMVT
jgi:hypothetical protein